MADADIPTSWASAGRSALGNSIWILPLVAFERVVEGHFGQAGVALLAWLAALAIAVKLHLLHDLISDGERQRQLLTWALILGGALLIGTGIYRLSFPSVAAGDTDLSQVDDLKGQLRNERDNRAVVDRQLGDTRRELQATIAQRDALQAEIERRGRQALSATQPRLKAAAGPVSWNLDVGNQLIVASGSGQTAVVNGLIFQGKSEAPLHFKEAYLISALTGHKVQLKANVQQLGTYFPITAVDVPADAPVQLDYIFDPALSVRDFFDQWGKFRFVVVYEDAQSFEYNFSEDQVRTQVQQMIPTAFGPRVTPREQK
ncbi:hypothetical protein [Bradyrhizobium sp. B120]|uniref:hypothetical protein n=1 Tax=Bradyrhizobium sp. B120 TaxID=3410088 RepID=UPI003B985CC0